MRLFDKFKAGLQRTKQKLSHEITRIVTSSPKLDEDTLEEIEFTLIGADLGMPMELRPNRGDVLFYHFLCAHSGSKNTNSQPRFALNTKW